MCPGQQISTSINTSFLAARQQGSCKQDKRAVLFPGSSTPVPTVQRTSVEAKK